MQDPNPAQPSEYAYLETELTARHRAAKEGTPFWHTVVRYFADSQFRRNAEGQILLEPKRQGAVYLLAANLTDSPLWEESFKVDPDQPNKPASFKYGDKSLVRLITSDVIPRIVKVKLIEAVFAQDLPDAELKFFLEQVKRRLMSREVEIKHPKEGDEPAQKFDRFDQGLHALLKGEFDHERKPEGMMDKVVHLAKKFGGAILAVVITKFSMPHWGTAVPKAMSGLSSFVGGSLGGILTAASIGLMLYAMVTVLPKMIRRIRGKPEPKQVPKSRLRKYAPLIAVGVLSIAFGLIFKAALSSMPIFGSLAGMAAGFAPVILIAGLAQLLYWVGRKKLIADGESNVPVMRDNFKDLLKNHQDVYADELGTKDQIKAADQRPKSKQQLRRELESVETQLKGLAETDDGTPGAMQVAMMQILTEKQQNLATRLAPQTFEDTSRRARKRVNTRRAARERRIAAVRASASSTSSARPRTPPREEASTPAPSPRGSEGSE